jgi:hypothetical protein
MPNKKNIKKKYYYNQIMINISIIFLKRYLSNIRELIP